VDECSAVVGACDDNSNCQNTEGSYDCACMTGFTGDGKMCTGESKVKQINWVEVCFSFFSFLWLLSWLQLKAKDHEKVQKGPWNHCIYKIIQDLFTCTNTVTFPKCEEVSKPS